MMKMMRNYLNLNFFTGGKNPKFEKYVTNFGLSSDNLEFLNFIQSKFLKKF